MGFSRVCAVEDEDQNVLHGHGCDPPTLWRVKLAKGDAVHRAEPTGSPTVKRMSFETFRSGSLGSGFAVGIVYFDPMPVKVLGIDLPNAVWPDSDVLRRPGEADIGHPALLQAGQRCLKISGC